MNVLSTEQQCALLERFPSSLRLSYETIPHKKVSPNYNLVVAIPTGRKAFVWLSFYEQNANTCLLMELNREKQISRVSTTFFRESPPNYSLGTIFYGTIYENSTNVTTSPNHSSNRKIFIIEDLYYYRGISVQSLCFGEKLGCIHNFMTNTPNCKDLEFVLPYMFGIEKTESYECTNIISKQIMDKIPYTIHHIQYRCLNIISPYLMVGKQRENKICVNQQTRPPSSNVNSFDENKTAKSMNEVDISVKKPHPVDIKKSQYKYPTVFKCKADMQYDIYHIYAYGKNNKMIYIGITHIPDLETSKMMNRYYRKIRENANLDYIEESEDEEDFENVTEDRFVDLEKQLNVECVFHMKYRRWIPKRIVSAQMKVIHIMNL